MSSENCVICMNTTENGDCVMLECGHIFHSTCIVQWYLDTRNGCPLCRAEPIGTYRKFMTDQGRIKLCKMLSRRKKCNKTILSLVKELKKKNKELIEIYRERIKWCKENEITVKDNNYFKNRIWAKQRQIRKSKNNLLAIPSLILIEELRKK